jgi:hypothetical protein
MNRAAYWSLYYLMRAIFLLSVCFVIPRAFAADIYTCPKLALANGHTQHAQHIDLYSGNPSEMAQLKPDNADTDDKGPQYWSMGPSQYDYWYVCNYKDNKTKREFKLNKIYNTCTNIGTGNTKNKLECK